MSRAWVLGLALRAPPRRTVVAPVPGTPSPWVPEAVSYRAPASLRVAGPWWCVCVRLASPGVGLSASLLPLGPGVLGDSPVSALAGQTAPCGCSHSLGRPFCLA